MRHGISHIIASIQRINAQPRNLLAIGILISIVSLGPASGTTPLFAGASADTKALISLYVDGQQRIISADDPTVGDVLRRANVKLGPNDLVEPAPSAPIRRGQFNINVYRSRHLLVQDGLRVYHVDSAYQSPRLLALSAGLVLYPEDQFHISIISDIVGDEAVGEKVEVVRAKLMYVKVDGNMRLVRTQANLVGEALKNAGISLGANDNLSVDTTHQVIAGMSIEIKRVTEAVVTLSTVLPRPVKTIPDPTMLKGQSLVKEPGSDGQKTITYRVHYTDGRETGRETIQIVSETAPVTKLVVEGTKVYFAGSVEHWRPEVELAAASFGIDPNMMLRIMNCESHGNATSVSHFIVNGEHPTGLFQFLPSTWISSGGTIDNIFDGSVQIKLAARKMSREGTGAWQCK